MSHVTPPPAPASPAPASPESAPPASATPHAAPPAPGAGPWWRRPVRLRDLLAVLLGTAVVWLAGSGLALTLLRDRLQDPASDPWAAAVVLRELPLTFTLPAGLRADARLHQQVDTQLQLRPHLAVPIDQTIEVRLDQAGPLQARARIDTVVDVATQFRVQERIDVDTLLDAQVQLVSWLPPLAVQVPVRLQVPVDVNVPVRTRVPVRIDAPVQAQVQGPLQVPLRTTLQVRPELRTPLTVQVRGDTGFRLLQPPRIDAVIEHAALRIGRGDVRLDWRDAAAVLPATSGASTASAADRAAGTAPSPAPAASR